MTETQTADRRQAEYFRRLLHERYTQLGEAIRTGRILRTEENERETLQRLIEALDARFPVHRPTTTPPAAQTAESLLSASRL